MNEELKNAIANLITTSVGAAEKAGEFLSGELPEYINELLWWHGAYNFVHFFVGFFMFVLLFTKGVSLIRQQITWVNTPGGSHERSLSFIVTALIGIPYFVFAGVGVTNLIWLQIWVAPKVFLIEYASEMLK